ncbi:suppressor of disruption of TFIIS-like isoform X1 [Panicum virgatum]|uniref:suppressor of disruption of TFIIS-like isoform X1 n=1 Tax=Panicum virgatum TaxID=38727 RepID=UPI0019D6564A|nr:suppressor of disruption of TFIIS-like isoform X1 [Panicum virgatum]
MAANSPFDCVLLDLDDTLYPGNTGLGPALKRNIDEFLQAKLGVSAERAAAMRVELFRTHGSSLAGLIVLGYDVHPDEYHRSAEKPTPQSNTHPILVSSKTCRRPAYVHGRLPYDRIAADPQLARLLQSIPQRKVLFTNSDRAHMKRALERLGVDEAVFDAVVCFETMNPHLFGEEGRRAAAAGTAPPAVVLKPAVDAIGAGLRAAGTNPRRTLFLDDSERNIAAGKALGLRTALVGKRVRSKGADYALESIGALRRVIPEIWGAAAAAAGDGSERSDHGIDKMPMRSDLDSIIQPTSIQA